MTRAGFTTLWAQTSGQQGTTYHNSIPATNEDIQEFRTRNCNTRETAKDSAAAKVARSLGSSNPAVNADIPNSSVRKSGVLKIIDVLEGRWAMLVR